MLDTTQTTAITLTVPASEEVTTMIQAQDLKSALSATGLVAAWCKAANAGSFYNDTLQIVTKQDYLTFRDNLKAWIRAMGNAQRALKKEMHQEGGNSTAQMRARNGAFAITMLIEIRRATKVCAGQARAENV